MSDFNDLQPLAEQDFAPQYEGQLPCRFFLSNWYTCSHEFCRRMQPHADQYGMNKDPKNDTKDTL